MREASVRRGFPPEAPRALRVGVGVREKALDDHGALEAERPLGQGQHQLADGVRLDATKDPVSANVGVVGLHFAGADGVGRREAVFHARETCNEMATRAPG